MNILKEKIDELNVNLKVTVTKEDYKDEVDASLRKHRKTAKVSGFRPGKVPIGLIRKTAGKAIIIEEVNKLIGNKLNEFLTAEEEHFLGEPMPSNTIKDKIDFDNDESFEFNFDLGYAPKLELNYKEMESIPYYKVDATAEIIDEHIKTILLKNGKSVEKDTISDKSMVKANVTAVVEGEEEPYAVKDVVFLVNKIKDEETKNLFVGAIVGAEIRVNFMKSFDNKTEVTSLLKLEKESPLINDDYNVVVNEITEHEEAELSQELYNQHNKEGNITSEEEFRAAIKEDIEMSFISSSVFKFGADAREYLNANIKIDLPVKFVERWLRYRNEKVSDADFVKEFPFILNELRMSVLKTAVLKKANQKIKISEDEMLEEAKTMIYYQFSQYGVADIPEHLLEEQAKKLLDDEKQKNNLAENITDRKFTAVLFDAMEKEERVVSKKEFMALVSPEVEDEKVVEDAVTEDVAIEDTVTEDVIDADIVE